MKKILITNALPYANGELHLGHMLGYIKSDIWYKYQKMQKNICYSICGSDTHGTAIMLSAKKNNILPENFICDIITSHIRDFKSFNIYFDNYHSTNSLLNKKIVNLFYNNLKQKNLININVISQLYDKKYNMFLPDRFIKGTCPICKTNNQYGDNCDSCGASYSSKDIINPISIVSNSNPIYKNSKQYFVNINKFRKEIITWIQKSYIYQSEIKNKLFEWFSNNLKDWNISRDTPYFGFPIPDVKDKFFYVWMDAPIAYIAGFVELCQKNKIDFNEYWNINSDAEIYHFIGKDIIYFHSIFWIAMLKSYNYRLPTDIFINGFVTLNNKKMSKSKNAIISVQDYLKTLKSDYLRYYFFSKLSNKIIDINLNLLELKNLINSDLIGKIINIASRCSVFINNNFNNILSDNIQDMEIIKFAISKHIIITKFFEQLEFAKAYREILNIAVNTNKYINDNKPWFLVKDISNEKLLHKVCSASINNFKIIMGYLKVIIPDISINVENFLNIKYTSWNDIPIILQNHKIKKFTPIINKINNKDIDLIKTTKK